MNPNPTGWLTRYNAAMAKTAAIAEAMTPEYLAYAQAETDLRRATIEKNAAEQAVADAQEAETRAIADMHHAATGPSPSIAYIATLKARIDAARDVVEIVKGRLSLAADTHKAAVALFQAARINMDQAAEPAPAPKKKGTA